MIDERERSYTAWLRGDTRVEPRWLWREFSWCLGDTHAFRLMRLLRVYCWLFRIDARKLEVSPPGVNP